MARPVKKGLDFFPLDVTVDDNLELLEAECGLEGFAIIIKLWQKIYATGYFIDWEEDNSLLFARKINSDLTTVNKVVNVGLNRGLFNKNLFNSYKILTSKGIQSRYTKICSDANRKDYSIFDDYNLINPELTTVKSEETLVKSESSTQSKVNKIKEDIYRKFKHLSITENEKDRILEMGYTINQLDSILDSIENYSKNKNYTSLNLTARKWLKREYGEPKQKIPNKTEDLPQWVLDKMEGEK